MSEAIREQASELNVIPLGPAIGAEIENVDEESAKETSKDRWPVPIVANERCGSVRIHL